MRAYPIALAAGLLPLLTIHICYVWAASNGHVPWCVPYLHSCTSISATGRLIPEYYFFKALMIPSAIIIFIYWIFTCRFAVIYSHSDRQKLWDKAIMFLAVLSCVGLIVYSLLLGAIGEEYRQLRRLGVISFYACTFLAQAISAFIFKGISSVAHSCKNSIYLMLIFPALNLVLALSAIVISSYDSEFYDGIEDAFEWWVTLMQCCFGFVVANIWKRVGFHISSENR